MTNYVYYSIEKYKNNGKNAHKTDNRKGDRRLVKLIKDTNAQISKIIKNKRFLKTKRRRQFLKQTIEVKTNDNKENYINLKSRLRLCNCKNVDKTKANEEPNETA